MRRELLLNWCEAHGALQQAIRDKVESAQEVGETGKGWTYVTFFHPGTRPGDVLFDVDRLDALARDNGFFLPGDVVRRHNKVLVLASSPGGGSAALYGLHQFLVTYAKRYADVRRHPDHGFYGKLGGLFERSEKGRVLAMYGSGDDALLSVYEGVEEVLSGLHVPGVRFEVKLSNGLSAIPRMLDGFGDPEYVRTGATHYRITDRTAFADLLEQARNDHPKYLFHQDVR